MSTASHALPGKLSFGSLLIRIIFIVLLWAGLVAGTLHYVGYVWPTEYQISQAEKAQAEEKEQSALAPAASPAPAPAANTAAPAANAATAATPDANVSAGAKVAFPSTTSSSSAPAAASSGTSTDTASPAPAAAATSGSSTSVAAATSAAPAASAPKATGEQKLPFDIRLAGYNRTALENVSVFFSIVISVFCVGAIILQVFQYKRTEA